MNENERTVFLAAIALGYSEGITDIDECVVYATSYLERAGNEPAIKREVWVLKSAYNKFKEICEKPGE